jgi:hypothetical protein
MIIRKMATTMASYIARSYARVFSSTSSRCQEMEEPSAGGVGHRALEHPQPAAVAGLILEAFDGIHRGIRRQGRPVTPAGETRAEAPA